MRRLAAFALLAAAASGWAAPASAVPLCVGVQVVVPDEVIPVGPFCVPYNGPVDCLVVSPEAGPVTVVATVCVPAP